MKRALSFLLALVLMLGVLAGCSSESSSSSSSSKSSSDSSSSSESSSSEESSSASDSSTAEGGVLRVGMECAYAPFNWTQRTSEVSDGSVAPQIFGTSDYAYGYDVILAQKLADELGLTLEVHKIDWSSIMLGLSTSQYDVIIAGMSYTAERDESVDFTQPYYYRDNVIVIKKDGPFSAATGLADFTGASCTTQLGTTWEHYVPQIPDVEQLTYFETTSEVIMAVSTGAADCAILDEPTALSAAMANPDITYIKLSADDGFVVPEGQSLSVCIAVREGEIELRDKLDAALVAIGWDEDTMKETMDLAVTLQPLS